MALKCAAQKAAFGSRVSSLRAAPLRVTKARVVRVHAGNPDRPLWFPGNPAPPHLDGSLAGDFGFDPLNLAQEPEALKWYVQAEYVQAELVHSRWAMLGVAGILFTSIGAKVGLGLPQWFEAGKVAIDGSKISFGTLLVTEFILFAWVEGKRWADLKNPGSQGDGSFLGFTDEFKGTENGYPGGRFFDPFGLSRGTPEQYNKYKESEIRNGRLAMIAVLGFFSQYAATGKGPIDNLADHLADPYHINAVTNGISVPFYGN